MLFQTMIMVGSGDLAERSSALGVESAEHMINNQLLSHFNVVRAVSVRRLLREKFILGLFDNPYVDIDHAAATVGEAEFVAAGADAQRQAHTLLTNHDQILPLRQPCRLYVEGVSEVAAARYGAVVVITDSDPVYSTSDASPADPRS